MRKMKGILLNRASSKKGGDMAPPVSRLPQEPKSNMAKPMKPKAMKKTKKGKAGY